MKQKVIIMLMLCQIQTLSLFAQSEHYSMLEGNPEWVYHMTPNKYASYWDPSYAWAFSTYGSEMFVRIYVHNDTTVDNYEYKYLYIASYDRYGKLIDGNKYNIGDRNNPSHFQFMREADGKVFSSLGGTNGVRFTKQILADISQYNQDESVMFDYDIHLGDTVYENRRFEYSLTPYPHMRNSIIAVPIVGDTLVQVADGSIRRKLTYGCKNYYQEMQYMIDGIGFINPDFYPLYSRLTTYEDGPDMSSCRHYINLLMYRQHNKVVYIAPRCKDDASYEEKAMSFAPMPFYPDITPESVADGTYTLPAAVDGIADNKTSKGKQIYNLQGQKTNGLQPGINIVGGKKVIVK